MEIPLSWTFVQNAFFCLYCKERILMSLILTIWSCICNPCSHFVKEKKSDERNWAIMEILSEQNKLELSNTLQDDWHAAAEETRSIRTGDLKKISLPRVLLSAWHSLVLHREIAFQSGEGFGARQTWVWSLPPTFNCRSLNFPYPQFLHLYNGVITSTLQPCEDWKKWIMGKCLARNRGSENDQEEHFQGRISGRAEEDVWGSWLVSSLDERNGQGQGCVCMLVAVVGSS